MEYKVMHNIVDDKSSLPPKYVKILHESMKHHGFEYKLGLNTDRIDFNPYGSCEPGGLYFTDLKSAELCLAAVQQNADALRYVPNEMITKMICLVVVQNNANALVSIPEKFKSTEICLTAVRKNGLTLHFVPEELKSAEICLVAVQQNGLALAYVPGDFKTEAICLAAVQQEGRALCYVPGNLIHKVTGLHYSKN